MEPTHKMQPKSTSSTTTTKPHHHHPHPLPDPNISPPSTTIQNYFPESCSNQKRLVSLIPCSGHSKPQLDIIFQAKSLSVPSVLDTPSPCTTLTKSKSQNERHNVAVARILDDKEFSFSTRTRVKEEFIKNISEIKKPSKKSEEPKRCSFKEIHVKKQSQVIESDQNLKRSQEGYEMRRPSIGGRRSFCSSQIELADFFYCNGVKVVAVDMPPFMQTYAVNCARSTHDSLEKFTSKTLAFTLKKGFDLVYGPAWHLIVGTGFGSFVTHSVGGFIYFSMDHKLYCPLIQDYCTES